MISIPIQSRAKPKHRLKKSDFFEKKTWRLIYKLFIGQTICRMTDVEAKFSDSDKEKIRLGT